MFKKKKKCLNVGGKRILLRILYSPNCVFVHQNTLLFIRQIKFQVLYLFDINELKTHTHYLLICMNKCIKRKTKQPNELGLKKYIFAII